MKIFVSVKAGAKKEQVEKIDDTHFKVSVKEPPIDGRANYGVERALASYFKTSLSKVNILKGHTSKQKVVEIM
ncbi:MAG: hypothetical protein COV02_02600 [Candidatus Terrybacteria bacterium CG10_big_fil_rev_8_21_14_0_10_41_10]|uniref:Uncharacterized protein n=1 Tax=Candidatus Terrybacteria bacterium CG10_big_fil_rev_8_21_14_0_10_41_10 TaxID=1975026 RepID=A0A2M8L9Z5_9BACT|nr:MAG: hypothetical protein COV02_02600 [Candidatus Terrybacteria bacterium CG10_big_fil_rev_8_21_14_0_10_41_10]